MLLEKKRLGVEDLEAQTALELPDRELMVLVIIANSLNDVVEVNVSNVNLAVQVCAIVNLINLELLIPLNVEALDCDIQQNAGNRP
jgi:hypothetical protein